MTSSLYIKNFAIIDKMKIDFMPGLTVITGETGSGKSLIIDALSVGIGGKTDKIMVKSGKESSVIDLEFLNKNYRRIISKNGRTKSFCNEEPLKIKKLKELFLKKIEIHGQHDQQLI